ncbi:DUF3558 domain-containing protein [Mycobacterium sp. MBM]|nr:DUF3558 domain-containing protein [Mycobacterium sp. MBM]
MRARGSRTILRSLAVAATVMAAAGCTQQVGGVAQPMRSADADDYADAGRGYGYTDDRCGLLTDDSVQSMLSADDVVRPYSGAVCQYVLTRGTSLIDATFAWFDTGDLGRERALALDRGAQVSDTVIERRPAFLASRDTTGSGCAATAAAAGGVLSWWVQVRNTPGVDACPQARMLLSATLRSDM